MNQGITFGKLWRRETIIGQAVASFLPPLVAIGLVAATVLGGRWQWASEANRRPATSAPPMSVSVFPATLQSGFEWSREFVGRVEARRASGIGFEIGGKLQRVLVDEGDVDVRVGVDREVVSQLREGKTHEVRIAGKPFQSKLWAIRPVRNASTRTVILGSAAALSAGLGLVNLWFADFPLGFNPLIGIALNDSIVVLAQIRTSEAARAGDIEAIVDEVMKTSRHVLSTTLTTIGGFLPLLMSGGDFWPPLAIVIAGGVGGASLLALYFVPAAYVTVRRFVERDPAAGSIDSLAMPSSSYHLRIGRQILTERV